MKHNLLRHTGSVLILIFVAVACSTAIAANSSGSEHRGVFFHSAGMSYYEMPKVSLASIDDQRPDGLVLAVATVNDRDRLDRLIDFQVPVPSGRELQKKTGSDGVSNSDAAELGNDSADEGLKVAQPSIRFEAVTMLLFGAGLISVAQVLRRKKKIK